MLPEPGPVRAPELDGAVAWLNTAEPVTLAGLRGKVVLLDFWTYGCINCLHVLPDLERLQARFADELVVVGIHAAKFDHERSTESIRRTLQRLGIRHPVANDARFAIWQSYTVRAWPTQVLIDPRGYVVGTATGEGHGTQLEEAIEAVVAVFDEQRGIDRTPRPRWSAPAPPTGPLAFPGKVLVDQPGAHLFIADTGHHRVLETDLEGRIRRVFGCGQPGRDDGAGDEARFAAPQGLAVSRGDAEAGVSDTLWVADAGNHLIRRVDLGTGRVSTVAGTGRQATWQQTDGGAALETSLNSPWDLAWDGRLLWVAMAGPHQVWLLDPARRLVLRYAGTGAEGRHDGHVDEAAFAQPSGLALLDRRLHVTDAEANVIRLVELPPVNQVTTIAGGNLFDFGDVDGQGDAVRLQHPLGLCVSGDGIVIADTYNHRLKRLDPATARVWRWIGTGRPGHVDGAADTACFDEPSGVSASATHVYVADTNNHAIRVVDVDTGVVRTLRVGNREPGTGNRD